MSHNINKETTEYIYPWKKETIMNWIITGWLWNCQFCLIANMTKEKHNYSNSCNGSVMAMNVTSICESMQILEKNVS